MKQDKFWRNVRKHLVLLRFPRGIKMPVVVAFFGWTNRSETVKRSAGTGPPQPPSPGGASGLLATDAAGGAGAPVSARTRADSEPSGAPPRGPRDPGVPLPNRVWPYARSRPCGASGIPAAGAARGVTARRLPRPRACARPPLGCSVASPPRRPLVGKHRAHLRRRWENVLFSYCF